MDGIREVAAMRAFVIILVNTVRTKCYSTTDIQVIYEMLLVLYRFSIKTTKGILKWD